MTELEAKTIELNELIIKGDSVKAIELFYADNVTMQENENEPRIGKQVCIDNEKQNLKNVQEFSSKLLNQAIDNKKNVVLSEWEILFVSKSNKKLRLTEVSVQHWDRGQIIKEKFYYKDFYPVK